MLNVKTQEQELFADVPEVSTVIHLSDVTMTHARKGLAAPTLIANLKAPGPYVDAGLSLCLTYVFLSKLIHLFIHSFSEMAMKEIHLSHVLSTLVWPVLAEWMPSAKKVAQELSANVGMVMRVIHLWGTLRHISFFIIACRISRGFYMSIGSQTWSSLCSLVN